ncbi:unnamed protein product [Peronospora belbahrii]|uniref:COX assembly mitochondrial protein n=1 Tax=Peronospora belbahrii TaxID=622444 RepID=A0AAU9L756_9STRA|nr:unnamed protein product [Peronospora belbahrii]
MLGKRCASEMEACLTEYYRQECLRALYAKQERPRDCTWVNKNMMAKPPRRARKGVSFAMAPEIIGSADPAVDRVPFDGSPVSKLELIVLLSQRTFPRPGLDEITDHAVYPTTSTPESRRAKSIRPQCAGHTLPLQVLEDEMCHH